MERKYWATRGKNQVGPFPTLNEAVETFRTTYPPKRGSSPLKSMILAGYGEFGAHFDISWHDSVERQVRK